MRAGPSLFVFFCPTPIATVAGTSSCPLSLLASDSDTCIIVYLLGQPDARTEMEVVKTIATWRRYTVRSWPRE